MSIAKNASRFDFLPDDAGDPFETASKKNKKNKDQGSGSGDAKKKGAKKNPTNSDRKQLQSLAFGSASEGKKKNIAKTSGTAQQNGCSNVETGHGQPSQIKENANDTLDDCKEEKNGNCSEKSACQRPKGISKEQWEQWQKRDADFADETYATDLQTALLQSKLEFETELKNKPPGKGKKKKPVAVPLNEFNARLTESGSSTTPNYTMNGTMLGQSSLFGAQNYQVQQPNESDEELVERFRMEAKLEIERERQKAIERQLLMSRQPPPPSRPPPVHVTSSAMTPSPADEKDLIISRLQEENLHLKGEVNLLRDRVKAINTYLQAAQDVKDKAKLIYELDNMTKANTDLNEELRQVHSQLEQEKSRSGAAMLELRRLLENRRRTTTEGSTS